MKVIIKHKGWVLRKGSLYWESTFIDSIDQRRDNGISSSRGRPTESVSRLVELGYRPGHLYPLMMAIKKNT